MTRRDPFPGGTGLQTSKALGFWDMARTIPGNHLRCLAIVLRIRK
jgi:hypothetical protein